MDGNSFTDLKNTLGVIYIVRDPRDVVISYAHHNNQTHEQTSKMITDNYILDAESKGIVPVYMGSWSLNYSSWKQFKDFNKYIWVDLFNKITLMKDFIFLFALFSGF